MSNYLLETQIRQILREEISNLVNKIPKSEFDPNQQIFTIEEAATFLRISKYTVRKYVRLGFVKPILTAVKGYRFHRSELERFASSYR